MPHRPPSTVTTVTTVIHAALVVDADRRFAPGALLVRDGAILACDSPQAVGMVDDAELVSLPGHVVMPALVNAHAHLDLSHIGPRPYSGDFATWIETLRQSRARDERAIEAAVRVGVAFSRAGGVAVVGDIAGVSSHVPVEAMRREGVAGVSFFEVFGQGEAESDAVARIRTAAAEIEPVRAGVALGVQPHAPFSCGAAVFEAAKATGRPLSTHLSETLDEVEFMQTGRGPLADMMVRFGAWAADMPAPNAHPVPWLLERLGGAPCLAAHVNYLEEAQIDLLAASSVTVVYCPRASAYFGHGTSGPSAHPYMRLIDAGVPVALGTDSIVCLNTADRISVIDDMRLLFQRDGMKPERLLRMATTEGARALGFDPEIVTLAPGPTAGVIAVPFDAHHDTPPLEQILLSDDAPEWIVGPVHGTALQKHWRGTP